MIAAPTPAGDPWASWEPLLTQFSQATSCTITLYTLEGEPAIGPLFSSDTGTVLAHASFFQPGGEGRRFEQALAARAALRLEPARDVFLEQLAVFAVPIVMFGRCHGTVVFGWLPLTFASALGAERVARASGADPRRLWTVLRLQPPLGEARAELYARFLAGLLDAHARLRETLAEVQAVTRLREESMARVAHELRTPLSSVMLRLSALQNTALDDPRQIRAALGAILQNVREESRMIDDIVDSARSRTGQLRLSPTVCNLLEVAGAAVHTIAPQAAAKEVSISVQWPADAVEVVHGDPARLQQVFWNLLANAVKFTNAGGTVRLAHRRRESTHDISITDSGVGIAGPMLGQIFEPFVRGQGRNDSGLGLGLSIARHIVELHGGRILVESQGSGMGSTFTVILPAGPERHDAGRPLPDDDPPSG
jgi:signal transduction histidine kinase